MKARDFQKRRLALRAILFGAAAAVCGRGAALLGRYEAPAGDAMAAWVAEFVPGDGLLSDLGARYLAAAATEASIPSLLVRIGERWPGGAKELVSLPSGSLRAALTAVVRRDLERADVVLVDGWVLARSEARLYAIAHLLRHQRAGS